LAGIGLGYEKVAFGVAYKNSNVCETSQDRTKVTNETNMKSRGFLARHSLLYTLMTKKLSFYR